MAVHGQCFLVSIWEVLPLPDHKVFSYVIFIVWPSKLPRHDFCVRCDVGVISLCFIQPPLFWTLFLFSRCIYLNPSRSSSFWVLSFSIKCQSSFILGKFSSIRSLRLCKISLGFILYLRDVNYPHVPRPYASFSSCSRSLVPFPCVVCNGIRHTLPFTGSTFFLVLGLCIKFSSLPAPQSSCSPLYCSITSPSISFHKLHGLFSL